MESRPQKEILMLFELPKPGDDRDRCGDNEDEFAIGGLFFLQSLLPFCC
jgi:hypothetical protein